MNVINKEIVTQKEKKLYVNVIKDIMEMTVQYKYKVLIYLKIWINKLISLLPGILFKLLIQKNITILIKVLTFYNLILEAVLMFMCIQMVLKLKFYQDKITIKHIMMLKVYI